MSTLSPSASVRPTTCFVSWSAKTAAPATSRSAIHCARAGAERALGRRDRLERRSPSSRCGRRPADASCVRARSSRRSERALVVDAERRVRNGLEPLLADRPAAAAHVPYVPSSIRRERASISTRRCSAFSSSPPSSSRMNVSVALSAMWSPEPIARSPVSSSSEPSWFTACQRVPQAVALALEHARGSDRDRRSSQRPPQPQRAVARPPRSRARRARRPCRATRSTAHELELASRHVERVGEKVEHRVVRLPALGRRRDAHLPGLAVPADDPGIGPLRERRAAAGSCRRAFHGPKDIGAPERASLAGDLADPALRRPRRPVSGRGGRRRLLLRLGFSPGQSPSDSSAARSCARILRCPPRGAASRPRPRA